MGCGIGMFSNYLALMSKDRQVLGIDMSENRIKYASETLRGRTNIKFLSADIKNVKFVECDAVVMTDFLHHISFEQQERLLKAVFERLRTGGKLIVQEVDMGSFFRFFLTKAIDKVLNPGKQLCYRNKDSWARLLRRAGFKTSFFRIDILFLSDMVFICDKAGFHQGD
jgi:2-polyprenyl-3-methyl-5-hydroxy-6-metoxy-1,4-benzoquinol methylase